MAKGADSRNRLYVADLGDPKAPNVAAAPVPVVEEDDGEFAVIGNVGSTLYVSTDLGAPRRKVVAISLAERARSKWRTILPEGAHTIENVHLTKTHLVVTRLVDGRGELSLYTPDGKGAGQVSLPAIGTDAGPGSRRAPTVGASVFHRAHSATCAQNS